jgi:hypothetical protein
VYADYEQLLIHRRKFPCPSYKVLIGAVLDNALDNKRCAPTSTMHNSVFCSSSRESASGRQGPATAFRTRIEQS